jgi:hypothetical protein
MLYVNEGVHRLHNISQPYRPTIVACCLSHQAPSIWFQMAWTQDTGWRRIPDLGQCSVRVLTMAISWNCPLVARNILFQSPACRRTTYKPSVCMHGITVPL